MYWAGFGHTLMWDEEVIYNTLNTLNNFTRNMLKLLSINFFTKGLQYYVTMNMIIIISIT